MSEVNFRLLAAVSTLNAYAEYQGAEEIIDGLLSVGERAIIEEYLKTVSGKDLSHADVLRYVIGVLKEEIQNLPLELQGSGE